LGPKAGFGIILAAMLGLRGVAGVPKSGFSIKYRLGGSQNGFSEMKDLAQTPYRHQNKVFGALENGFWAENGRRKL
jgi:hypothetical protein